MSTILVVEDTQDNYDLIEDALEEAHELVHATTAQDALAIIQAVNPDLILLDMGLPGMTGWELSRRLKEDRNLAAIPIVAVTAHAMTGDREKCLDAGCDDYIAKPITVCSLVSLVDRYLSVPGAPKRA